MKHIKTFVALALSIPLVAQAQPGADSAPMSIDTISVYAVNLSRIAAQGKTEYFINDKPVTEAEYRRVASGFWLRDGCAPCYMRRMSLDDVLLDSGLYYYDCPGSVKTKPEDVSGPGEVRLYRGNPCPHGEWKTYRADGKVKKVVYYEYGKKVKKPKRKK